MDTIKLRSGRHTSELDFPLGGTARRSRGIVVGGRCGRFEVVVSSGCFAVVAFCFSGECLAVVCYTE